MLTARTKVLVSNDDGVAAPGIAALVNSLVQCSKYDVRVVAPNTEKSACSHSVTLRRPLHAQYAKDGRKLGLPVPVQAWSVVGTPVDAVGLALSEGFFEVCGAGDSGAEPGSSWKPDVVVSGINRGANYGRLAYYSGTVGAAREATFLDVKAMAVSLDSMKASTMDDFAEAALLAVPLVDWFASESQWPKDVILNVNIPSIDKSFCSKYPPDVQPPTRTSLAISKAGSSTIRTGFNLTEKEPKNEAPENGLCDSESNGITNLEFKMRPWRHYAADASVSTDDGIAVSRGFTALSPIPPAYALDKIADAEKCLSDWKRQREHPIIEWFDGE